MIKTLLSRAPDILRMKAENPSLRSGDIAVALKISKSYVNNVLWRARTGYAKKRSKECNRAYMRRKREDLAYRLREAAKDRERRRRAKGNTDGIGSSA